MYQEMAKHITAATTDIDHVPSAASEIDRVLNTMMKESRPIYIGLSVDKAYEIITGAPLDMPIVGSLPLNDPGLEAKVISQIRSGLGDARNPILILDGGESLMCISYRKLACEGAVRHGVLQEIHELIVQANIPAFTRVMGEGGLNEIISQFSGVHQGAGTHPGVKEALEQADYVLWVGNYPVRVTSVTFLHRY